MNILTLIIKIQETRKYDIDCARAPPINQIYIIYYIAAVICKQFFKTLPHRISIK